MKLLILILIISFNIFSKNISIGTSFYQLDMNLVIDSDQSFEPKWKHQVLLTDQDSPELLLAIALPKSYSIQGIQQNKTSVYNYYIPIKEGTNNYPLQIKNQNNDIISNSSLSIKLSPIKELSLMSESCIENSYNIQKKLEAPWIYTYCTNRGFQQYSMFDLKMNIFYEFNKDKKKITKIDSTPKVTNSPFDSSLRLQLGFSYFDNKQSTDRSFINIGLSKTSLIEWAEIDFGANLDLIPLKGLFLHNYSIESHLTFMIKDYYYGSDFFHFKPFIDLRYTYDKNIAFNDKGFLYSYIGLQLNSGENFSVFYSTSLFSSFDTNSSSRYGLIYHYKCYDFYLQAQTVNAVDNQQVISFDKYQFIISKRI